MRSTTLTLSSSGPIIRLLASHRADNISRVLHTRVASKLVHDVTALIDTSAAVSGIGPLAVQRLRIASSGTRPVIIPGGVIPVSRPAYDIHLAIAQPEGPLWLPHVLFVEANPPSADILIGRDILADCRMIYDGPKNLVTLIFE